MLTTEFEYYLPPELIAQTPAEPRDSSRLLIVDRNRKTMEEGAFRGIIHHLAPGDVLVLNDTRVIPARLWGQRRNGGKAELLLLKDLGEGRWEAIVRPGRKLAPGTEVIVGGETPVKILERTEQGGRIIAFPSPEAASLTIKRCGKVPLPPYIRQPLADPERYQTVYAQKDGSSAATTAALHFTRELLQAIQGKGIEVVHITLHMGLGSFRPIREESLEEHRLPPEYYLVPQGTADKINEARRKGRQVIACGTGTMRALETAGAQGEVQAGKGATNLFILPGHHFQVATRMLTNFHLPRSSHLVLVCAFAGRDIISQAYQYAIERRFRFYSFGDAMLIL